MKHRLSISGQTLLEVVIATSLLIIALTVMVGAVATANANNRRAKERAVAVRLAQSAQDALRGMRDRDGWIGFSAMMSNGLYCMEDLENYPTSGDCVGTFESAKTNYRRVVVFSNSAANSIDYKISVYWWSGRDVEEETYIEGRLTEWR